MATALSFSGKASMEDTIISLGDPGAAITWVYLCGLTDSFECSEEIENRKILDRIGQKNNIRFLAIHPFERCELAGNKLCWRHYTPFEAFQTYKKLLEKLQGVTVAGMIGFSNGGYFLNYLSQLQKLSWPVVSIGAAGEIIKGDFVNHITLMIGKKEVAYNSALQFTKNTKKTLLNVKLIEHAEGHIIPEALLMKYFLNTKTYVKSSSKAN